MDISLTSKVARSAGWVFSAKVLARLFEIIKLVVLARLLLPEDFGLFGLVMLTTLILETFSETGLRAALVQHKGDAREYLNTAWTIQILRGGILSLILFLVAPLVAWFFKEPRIVLPLRAMCLSFLVQGFINIETIYFEKDLKFKKQFYYDITANGLSLVIGIVLAYMLRSVWALIWANLTAVSIKLILSYAKLKYRPRFQFIRSHSKELFEFGRWMSGYGIALFGWQQLDKLFIGKLLGPIPLGIYQIAQRVADIPLSNIAAASVNLTFPAYSKIQQEPDRLGKAFLDVLETVMSLVVPIIVFSILAAPDIVHGLLTERWKGCQIALQILSMAAFFSALDTLGTPLFVAMGRPHIEFLRHSLKTGVLLVTIYPFTLWWGLTGSCVAVAVSSAAALPVWARIRSMVNIRWSDIFTRLLFPFACGVAVMLSVLATHILIRDSGILSLAVGAALSLIFLSVITLLTGMLYEKGLFIHIRRTMKAGLAGKDWTVSASVKPHY